MRYLAFVFTIFLCLLTENAFSQKTFCVFDDLVIENFQAKKNNFPPKSSPFQKDEIIYIRTVFHVLHARPEQNFSDVDIEHLIEEANAIFRGEGVDTSLVHPQHRAKIHDAKIQLCLAKIDPEGNATNGITHTAMSQSYFPLEFSDTTYMNEPVKTDSLGGKSPWDTERYFNIWVAPMIDDATTANYGQPLENYYPAGQFIFKNGIQGAVIDSKLIIDQADVSFWIYPPGVLAHECGHALGLLHIWGNYESGDDSCLADDFMEDKGFSYKKLIFFKFSINSLKLSWNNSS